MPQGELVIGKILYGAAMNCLIIPAEDPDAWFFKQFFSTNEIEQFALEHDLIIKREDSK
jgi:hypothetical protein